MWHLDWCRRSGLSEVTREHRSSLLGSLDGWLTEHHQCGLVDATAEMLNDWQSWLINEPDARTGKPRSLTTMRTYTSHARMFYRWLRRNGYREDDPTQDLPMPTIPPSKPRDFPEEDLLLAVRCAPDLERAWLVLAAWLGLRRGEVSRIRREDVRDRDDMPTLRVRGKGGHGEVTRTIPLPAEVLQVLRPYLGVRHGPIFRRQVRRYGDRRDSEMRCYTPDEVGRRIIGYLTSLGMPYSLHWGRHRAITHAIRAGWRPTVVQRLSGHKRLDTLQIYIHEADRDVAALADEMSGELGPLLSGRRLHIVPPDPPADESGDPT